MVVWHDCLRWGSNLRFDSGYSVETLVELSSKLFCGLGVVGAGFLVGWSRRVV